MESSVLENRLPKNITIWTLKMNKILAGLLFAFVLNSAEAHTTKPPKQPNHNDNCDTCLFIQNESTKSFSGYDGQPKEITGSESKGSFGSLDTKSAGTVFATYLGNESSYSDSFKLSNGATLTENNKIGDTISATVEAGLIGFTFFDNHSGTFANGSTQGKVLGFIILDGAIKETYSKKYGTFEYLLGFNDSSKGDADYDDFVVGINFVCAPVTAVPEPESYAMMLIGLGLMGFVAKRRTA